MLDGIQQITGDLVALGVENITSISAGTLTAISGNFSLAGLPTISALHFPVLNTVGNLSWISLGPLIQDGFPVLNNATGITVQDTHLENLGFSKLSTVCNVTIAKNKHLSNISLPCTSITNTLSILGNGNGQFNVTLPNLQTAGAITIGNASTLSLPLLRNVTNAARFSNNNFTALSLPFLLFSGGLSVGGNNNLTTFSVPRYTKNAAYVDFLYNTGFTGVLSFPLLKNVGGRVYFDGNFSRYTTPIFHCPSQPLTTTCA